MFSGMRTLLAIALAFALLFAFSAQAERRVALVIGNDKYAHLPNLNNAGKDARDMAAKLKTLGFEVIGRYNASEREMGRAIRRFSARLSAGGTGLAFYAGHGVQADGTNYLIPADANIEVEDDLRYEALDANDILQATKDAGNPLNILILDACRDNPLPKRTRSAARGLAITAVPSGAKGTAILYAAGPGQTAQDGPEGGNGVFTGALLKHMGQPGWTLEQVFKATSREVLRATNNRQRPWQLVSMQGDFLFKSTKAVAVASTPKPSAPQSTFDKDALFWQSIKDGDDPAMFAEYLRQYPNGTFAGLAKIKLGKLKSENKAVAVTAPPKPKVELVPVEAAYVTTRSANVRADPSINAAKVITLPAGVEVYVPARTKDGDWLKVERRGKPLGYVYNTLLEDKAALGEARRKSEEQKKQTAERRRIAARQLAAIETRLDIARKELKMERKLYAQKITSQRALLQRESAVAELEGEKSKLQLAALQPSPKPSGATKPKSVVGLRFAPGDAFKDCAGCPEMVVIPAGSFMIGSSEEETRRFNVPENYASRERPQNDVRIGYSFAVGKHEITRGQFARFVADSGHNASGECTYWTGKKWEKDASKSWRNPGYDQNDSHPVACVNWQDAQAYMAWLSRKTSQGYRLLSEAEWEYAARAGTSTARYWGDDWGNSAGCDYANVHDSTSKSRNNGFTWTAYGCSDGVGQTARVGRYRPNRFGLYDMIGNVWEWTADCFKLSYAGAPTDGSAIGNRNDSCSRVLRGGSWVNYPRSLRSASRIRNSASYRVSRNGFRVARDLK